MPPRKKVLGHDQQTGQPIYDENLPSPMEIDPLEPLPATDTVPLDALDTMNGVSADPYYDDSDVPQEVVSDVAGGDIPTTGMSFDFNSLNVQTREDFDRLPLEQQELLKAMKRGVRFTPESAANFVLQQTERQQRLADETSKSKTDPRGQAIAKQQALRSQAVLDSVQNMRQTVNDLLEHPGFSGSVGAKNQAYLFGLKSQPVAGTKEADFKAMLDQVQGGAFLQAFDSLKGGGQITQVEGEKATQAIVRAQQSQSEEGFKKSMNDFLSVLDKAEKRAKSGETVQQPSTPAATAAAPRPTKTVSGIVWEKGDDGKWYRKR